MIELERLLAPISADSATGPNIREDSSVSTLYYQIKDARSAARLVERQADAEAERGAIAGEWRIVSDLCQQVLAEHSKDIEIAAWLAEASIRLDGFAGLRTALAVLDGLVERYWPQLHALDDDDVSAKAAPLAGLNGAGAEGSLIQPIRLAAITDPADKLPVSLWDYMQMRKRGPQSAQAASVISAVRATSPQTILAIFQDIRGALQHYDDLTNRLVELCGEDAPPSSAIRNVLEESLDALRDVARDPLAMLGAETERRAEKIPEPPPITPEAAAPIVQPEPPMGPQPLRSREDALRELARIAAFFQEFEPNSPTAYSLETTIRRARLPLTDLLAELIPEEASRRTFLDMAGIRTPGMSP
jgi:type VI secretion system protein ImpA